MPEPNFVDKTIWTEDNLDILRGLNSESVDLISLDPAVQFKGDYMPVYQAPLLVRALRRLQQPLHVIP